MTKCIKELVVRKGVVFIVSNICRDRVGLYKIILNSESGEKECLNCLPEGITMEVCE